LGAKLKAAILISPMYGSDIALLPSWPDPQIPRSVPRREYPLERDDEVEHEKRLHVVVGLAAADRSHRPGVHLLVRRRARYELQGLLTRAPDVTRGGRRGGGSRVGVGGVQVGRDLVDGQRHRLEASRLAHGVPRALVYGHAAAQVGQGE